jgi:hypothetical protein
MTIVPTVTVTAATMVAPMIDLFDHRVPFDGVRRLQFVENAGPVRYACKRAGRLHGRDDGSGAGKAEHAGQE